MRTTARFFLAGTILLLASCATAPTAPRASVSEQDRYLIDPRTGYSGQATQAVDKRFTTAWRAFEVGDHQAARTQFQQILSRNAGYTPAELGMAAVDIREGTLDRARAVVARVLGNSPGYVAAQVYDAEIALRQNDLRRAYDTYARVAASAGAPPQARTRLGEIRNRLLQQVLAQAGEAPPEAAIPLLREALLLDPAARPTRLLLVRKLLETRNWDAARAALDPLLNTEADKPEVQEALAEIEVGRGLYENAIARYERLVRVDARYAQRLARIKQDWSAANMPPHFVRAYETDAITRSDLAILLYWKAASIRFAQNLSTPPIAVDIGDVNGREEVIRAIAIGMLQVDPVTRRVNPTANVTAAQLTRYTARVLTNRGAACARKAPGDPNRILAECGVNDLTTTLPPDALVSGRAAADIAVQIDRALNAG